MSRNERRGLGRGLGALISPAAVAVASGSAARSVAETAVDDGTTPSVTPGDTGASEQARAGEDRVVYLPLGLVDPDPSQPRKSFSEAELSELSDSIKRVGLLQPVLVRPAEGRYRLVAGERRWRAARSAGLFEVPAVVRRLDDRDALQIAIIENVQRQDLDPIEEARAYERLITEFAYTQEELSGVVGKHRAVIANSLRLLKLPDDVRGMLSGGEISVGHAKVLLGLRDPAARSTMAKKVVSEGMSVRTLEQTVEKVVVLDRGKAAGSRRAKPAERPSVYGAAEDRLRTALGTRISIEPGQGGGGKIVVDYFSEEDLHRIVEAVCRTADDLRAL